MKMKKVLSASLMAGVLTMGTILPVFASAGATTSTGGNTVVSIGIDKNATAPGQLSVTVPTNLGILLHAPSSGDSNPVDVYVGGGAKGDVQGQGSGSLNFVNNSKNEAGTGQAVEIKSATVSSLGKWALEDFDSVSNAYKMGLKINGTKVTNVAAGGSSVTTFSGLTLAPGTGDNTEFVGTTTSVPLSVKVGGQGSNYSQSEATAPAFNVEWRITKQG